MLAQAADGIAGGDGAAVAEARRAVGAHLGAIRGRLLGARDSDLSADEHFALVTRAMDAVFAWLEADKRAVAAALGAAAGDASASGRRP